MARSTALIDREPLKMQEGTLENVEESTCQTIGKGGRFCRIKNEKKKPKQRVQKTVQQILKIHNLMVGDRQDRQGHNEPAPTSAP
jgi:hypothetical protein